jgi:hypothetical protein
VFAFLLPLPVARAVEYRCIVVASWVSLKG